jgi:ESS family glutamate:Na+ symporter
MTIPPLITVLLAMPALLLGELLVRRIRLLERSNIPAPVVGGLLVAFVVLAVNLSGAAMVKFAPNVTAAWWTWLVTIEPEWVKRPEKSLSVPLLGAFYVCVGLNSTWAVVSKGSVQVVIFLAAATLLGLVQNFVGVTVATMMGLHPLMGVLCGSVTMVGGHGTVIGFSPDLVTGGLAGAAVIGSAMATMGLVVGSLVGGPVGGWLIRRGKLRTELSAVDPGAPAEGVSTQPASPPEVGIVADARRLAALGVTVLYHVVLVVACIKAGAWASYFLAKSGVNFPVHIGAMILGVIVRNVADAIAPGRIRTEVVSPVGSVFLAFFLAIAMMSLNLMELRNAALPMLVMLAVQLTVVILFAVWITFRVMGRDYEAAQMAAGHCGFGIGNTANAVASMKSLVEKYGPAPRAFLVIPLVGGMLGDLTNAVNITFFIKWLS